MNRCNSIFHSLCLGLFLFLSACSAEDMAYNQWRCATGVEGKGFLTMELEGEEEKLKSLMTILRQQLGNPKVTFLHYTLETYEEFFHPEGRAINLNRIVSPFGIQKILVWDSLYQPQFPDMPLQVSLQVEEHRRGKRPIDPYDCTLELRVRTGAAADMLPDCQDQLNLQGIAQRLTGRFIGAPHGRTDSEAFVALEERYAAGKAAYAERVGDILDPNCYPVVSLRGYPQTMDMRICELDGMRDTLRAEVEVLDAGGDRLAYLLLDEVAGKIATEVMILDGMSGYVLQVADVEEVAEIRFRLQDGRIIVYYEKGDCWDTRTPYKPRYDKEYFKRRREERRQEKARGKSSVNA